ncbi:MAG: PD40 domain-containing protein, partial [Verrucomicrobia bacterium]|nr:PD40 domain-containing protein [Verrucomicrobiota bacterium]
MSRTSLLGRALACLFGAALLSVGLRLSLPSAPAVEPVPLGPDERPLWLRYPALSPDGKNIAFIFRGHLFRVAASGGQAVALTAGSAHQTAPVWSPDGQYLAFASDDYGNYDIYLVSADGGPVRRLTDHSADEIPTGFTPDGRYVIFSAHRMNTARSSKFPLGRVLPELYRVSVDGGKEPEQILTTPALNARCDRSGRRIVYEDVKGYEDLWRKHETFSVAHDIWLYDANSRDHTRLTSYPGEDRDPVWAPDETSVFYLSEQSGSFNVWRLPLQSNKPGTPVQITRFDKNPVRFLSCDRDGQLCFGYDGEIYTLAPGATEPQRVPVRIALADNRDHVANQLLSDGVTEVELSPNGKELVLVIRGDVYVTSVEHGETKRITNTPGQERSVHFSPDGRRLIFAAESNGPWAVYEASIAAPKEKEPYFFGSTLINIHAVVKNDQENFQPRYSPDGKEVAYLENRTTLKVINLDTKQARVVLPGEYNYSYEDNDQWYDWAPDGKWFLVTFLDRNRWSAEAGIVDAEGKGQLTNLTKSGYDDLQPRWVNEGSSMIWLTDRYGLHGDGAGRLPQVDVYEMFFTRDAFDRFRLSPAEFAVLKEKEDEAKKAKDKDKDKSLADQKPGAAASPSPDQKPALTPGSDKEPATVGRLTMDL